MKKIQVSRCMDCGTFCQTYTGCPINNLIPEWNNLVFNQQWKSAYERLHKTNNFLSLQVEFVRHHVKVHVFWD